MRADHPSPPAATTPPAQGRVSRIAAIALLAACAGRAAAAANVDMLRFGDAGSERQHHLTADQSEAVRGGLGEPARRLLPLSPASFDGGSVSFDLAVDPARQNYLTVKLWGSDRGSQSGRLILYADGLQVGYRHEGDLDVLNQTDDAAEAPGRWVYQTVPLPTSLTRGKASLPLKIAALGPMWPYGANFQQYQKPLEQPSRGIYAVYTGVDAKFEPDPSEAQGTAPDKGLRDGPGEEVIGQSRTVVNGRLTELLAHPPTGRAATDQKTVAARLLLVGEAYVTPWTAAFHNPGALAQVVRDGDAVAAAFAADPNYAGRDWPGAGPMGEAIVRSWPAVQPSLGPARRHAWASALRQSVDYWRTHRRDYTNQSMIVDRNIWTANRALELIEPDLALPAHQTLAYLYQAVGLDPWLGSDPGGGGLGDTASHGAHQPYGTHYKLVTDKGLTRELGWVATYGETILHFTHDIAQLTGDGRIRQQLAKLEAARMPFRYPGVDDDGFRCMKLPSEVDNRTAHYPLEGAAYTAPDIREEWWMDVPALLSDDPVAVGAAQQALADHQYFAYVQGRLKDPDTLGMMRNVAEYERVKSLPPSPYRLPMTPGQPDFAFADEQDAIVALKHGDERLFVNLYYRAERGVNGVARILDLTPTLTRLATAKTQTQVIPSGQEYARPDWIDAIRSRGMPPPGEDLHQAWAGERLPISARPADAKLPEYGQFGPFVGKAAFYQLRYGDYLIGLNTTDDHAYTLDVPGGRAGVPDLISGKPLDASAGHVPVPPRSTVILYLGR